MIKYIVFVSMLFFCMTAFAVKNDRVIVGVYYGNGIDGIESLLKLLNTILDKEKYTIQLVDSYSIKSGAFDENDRISMLIIPGGASLPVRRELGVDGINKIRNFIKNGGSFLGICAGGYFASEKIFFGIGSKELEIVKDKKDDNIAIMPISTVGPIDNCYDYNSKKCAKALLLKYNNIESGEISSGYVYYNGGFWVEEISNDINVLGSFSYNNKNYNTILQGKYGKGRVIITGVHIETGINDFKNDETIPKIEKQIFIDYDSDFGKYVFTDIIKYLIKKEGNK